MSQGVGESPRFCEDRLDQGHGVAEYPLVLVELVQVEGGHAAISVAHHVDIEIDREDVTGFAPGHLSQVDIESRVPAVEPRLGPETTRWDEGHRIARMVVAPALGALDGGPGLDEEPSAGICRSEVHGPCATRGRPVELDRLPQDRRRASAVGTQEIVHGNSA